MTNYCRPAERRLNRNELAFVLNSVKAHSPGLYTLKQLLAETWTAQPRPRAYGKWFKAWRAQAGNARPVRPQAQKTSRSRLRLAEVQRRVP